MTFKIKEATQSIAAGMIIGLMSMMYLSIDNKLVGALLFGTGLVLISAYGYLLFTGVIGYLKKYTFKYELYAYKILLFNLIGICIACCFTSGDITQAAASLFNQKLARIDFLYPIINSIWCGFCMYFSVKGWKTNKNLGFNILATLLMVAVFLICGFEHCIADAAFIVLGKAFSGVSFLFLLTVILGNVTGALIGRLIDDIINNYEVRKR